MAKLHWIALVLMAALWPFAEFDVEHRTPVRWGAVMPVSKLEMTVEAFRLDCGRLPHSLDELLFALSDNGPCTQQLNVRPADLRDGWGNYIHYWKNAAGSRFALHSLGADGVYASADDYASDAWQWPWPNPYRKIDWPLLTAFIGLPSLLILAVASGLVTLLRAWRRRVAMRLGRAEPAQAAPAARRANPHFWRGAGFILLTICLFLLFAAIGTGYCPRRPDLAAEAQLRHVQSAIEAFRVHCRQLPSRLDELVEGATGSGCRGPTPIRQSQQLDDWRMPLHYVRGPGATEFRLSSLGADRRQGTADDIVLGAADQPWRASYRPPLDGWALLERAAAFTLLGMFGWGVLRTLVRLVRRLGRWHRWRRSDDSDQARR